MKNLLLTLGFALFFLARPAAAQTGSYCSIATTDGTWAYVYGWYNIQTNCNSAQSALYYRTAAPVWGYQEGYYWLNGYNQVSVSCNGFQNYFTGYGNYPLAAAYNWAAGSGLAYCIFR